MHCWRVPTTPAQYAAARFGGRVPDGYTLTLRVDRGSQFIAHRFQEAAKTLGITLEYAGIQCPDDKPYIESFFGHYKTEEVYRTSYTRLAEGQVGWSLYRIWYEAERVHESLDYQTPRQRLAVIPRTTVSWRADEHTPNA